MKIYIRASLVVFFLISLTAKAQTNKATTTRIVNEKNYVFVATAAIPSNSADISRIMGRMNGSVNGGNISLVGSGYDLVVNADSLVAYLPYYGRAYSGSFNNDENGFKFTAKSFQYASTKSKKGWDIAMVTKDVKDNVRLALNITESGYATLHISSNNRQPITFNGYLREVDDKKQ